MRNTLIGIVVNKFSFFFNDFTTVLIGQLSIGRIIQFYSFCRRQV